MTELEQYKVVTCLFVVLFLFLVIAAIKLICFINQDFEPEEKQ